jgi:Ca2+-binding RTX toxin-like protein
MLISIENVYGSIYGDTLTGNAGANTLEGLAGNDTLSGEAGNDTLLGGDGQDLMEGGLGNDTIDGGTITDTLNMTDSNTVSYQGASGAVAVNLSLAQPLATGADGTDVLLNINIVNASGFDDTITGSARTDVFERFRGGAGNDSIDGGGGSFDFADFSDATGGVTVTLTGNGNGTATGAGIGTDTLKSIQGIIGSNFADVLTGSASTGNAVAWVEVFRGEAGNDTIDGGAGFDFVLYDTSTSGVVVTLGGSAAGTAQDGLDGTDVLRNIEAVTGSAFADTLTGSSWNEALEGRAGKDVIDGQGGTDNAYYFNAVAGINVDLSQNKASKDGYGSSDVLLNIENVTGSRDFNDSISGDSGDNRLEGNGGNDTLRGGAGQDFLVGGTGDDFLDGGTHASVLARDQASYEAASGAVQVNLATGRATGADGNDTLTGIDMVLGSAYADTLTGDVNGNVLRGNGGNDTIDGGAGFDWADYKEATSSVTVSLVSNTSSGGNGNDTLINIEGIRGGQASDTLTGDANDNQMRGNGGDDLMDAGAGMDTADYFQATGGVTVNLATGTSSGADGNDTLTSFENISGSFNYSDSLTGSDGNNSIEGLGGNDTLLGGAGQDTLVGGTGDDSIDGGSNDAALGRDWVSYEAASAAVQVNLATGRATGADGNDTLTGVEGVLGSAYADTLTGDANSNALRGNGGNDTIDGGAGFDWADYGQASGSVTVSLVSKTSSGFDGNDTLINIEGIRGGQAGDTLTGDANDNQIRGNGGNDLMDGGAGVDTADYYLATGGVTVNLATGRSSGADGNDTLSNFENISGSFLYADSLTGSDGNNSIDGLGGDDTLVGGAGQDTLLGGDGSDKISISDNGSTDSIDGGAGWDNLGILVDGVAMTLSSTNFKGIENFNLDGNRYNATNAPVQKITVQDSIFSANTNDIGVYLTAGNAVLNVDASNVAAGHSLRLGGGSWFSNNDTLLGGAGDDYLNGAMGNDSLSGGLGKDTAGYYFGQVQLTGLALTSTGTGTWTLTSATGALLTLQANTSTGVWTVSDARTAIASTSYALGVDTLNGIEMLSLDVQDSNGSAYRAGNLYIGGTLAVPTLQLADGANVGTPGNDMLIGSNGDDTIYGNGGEDTIDGAAGNDLLFGNGGRDALIGGSGDDTLFGGADRDTVYYGNAPAGVVANLTSYAGVKIPTATDGQGGTDTLISIEQIVGSAFADDLTVGRFGAADGGAGNDTLRSGFGTALLYGGAGNDTLYGSADIDVAGFQLGTSRVDGLAVAGSVASGWTVSAQGANLMQINLNVSVGTWTVQDLRPGSTGFGTDSLQNMEYLQLDGSIGSAFLKLTGGTTPGIAVANVITGVYRLGGQGLSLDGTSSDELIYGSDTNDVLSGNAGNDTLIGGDGYDRFIGGAGDDLLLGGWQLNLSWRFGRLGQWAEWDIADYSSVTTGGVKLDLSSMQVTGLAQANTGTDTLRGIEEVDFTRQHDEVVGTLATLAGNNEFAGDQHELSLVGYGGSDSFSEMLHADTPWQDMDIEYWWSQTGITVTLTGSTGTVSYGAAGTPGSANYQAAGIDTLSRISEFADTSYDDIFNFKNQTENAVVGQKWAWVHLSGGNDTVIGNGDTSVSFDIWGSGQSSTGKGVYAQLGELGVTTTVNRTHLSADGSAFGITQLTDVDGVTGTSFDDTLMGSSGDEHFRGQGGSDLIDGGGGKDTAKYLWGSTTGIKVSMQDGTVTWLAPTILEDASQAGTDTLRSIEIVHGTNVDDIYDARGFSSTSANAGSAGLWNQFQGNGGNDTIFGNGSTSISYHFSSVAVDVNLATGQAKALSLSNQVGELAQIVGNDTFNGVNEVVGSVLGDKLTGDALDNRFKGGAGDDTLIGGEGIDKAIYAGNQSGYTVTTTTNGVTVFDKSGVEGTDTLLGIEQLIFADSTVVIGLTKPTSSVVTVVVSPASVSESGSTNLTYTFTRSGDTSSALSVNLGVGGTASAADYTSNLALATASEPTKVWTKLQGTSGDDYAYALTTGLDGSIYVSGYTNGALDGQTNSGSIDAFLTKYSADGTKAWTKLLGTSGNDEAYALTTGLDGSVYVSGYTTGVLDGQTHSGGNGDAFLAKYSADGTKAWTKLLGTSGSDSAHVLATGLDGSIYVSGWTTGALDGQTNSGGNSDAFLTKYSADGTKAWTKLLGSSGDDYAEALTTGLDGSIYVSGYTTGALDGQTKSGNIDAFLTKYSTDGSKVWTKLLGSGHDAYGEALTTGLDGSIYVSGWTTVALDGQTYSGGNVDAFLTKYSTDGTKAWSKLLGSSGDEGVWALTTGLDGSIYVSGSTTGALDGQNNSGLNAPFLTKYSTDGTKASTILLGQLTRNDTAHALTTGLDGSIYVSGATNGAFDGQTNNGGDDAFLTKFSVGSPQITFAAGASTATLVVDPTPDKLPEGSETLAVTVMPGTGYSVGTAAVAVGTIVDVVSSKLSGIVYDWKNHMLLQDVAVAVKGVGAAAEGANAPIQFKGLVWDASGHGSVEVWAHVGSAVENIGFELEITNASGISFSAGTLPNTSTGAAGWTLITNASGSNLDVAGFANDSSAAVVAGDFKLGTITFETASLQRADLHLLSGAVGSTSATAYGLSMARNNSNASGEFSFSTLEPGSYGLSATRSVSDVGSAVNSADALAALKIAVGLNPNPDPDGAGSLKALAVSPYQFMAADVVGTDGRVTSADALAILKMAVKLPTAPAKEWMFVEEDRDFWNEATGQFTLDRSHANWDHSINTTLQADGVVNLVGVLKGDVNGSWVAPVGSIDLDVIDPTHFSALSSIFGMPLSQFGIV